MKAHDLAKELLKMPNLEVLLDREGNPNEDDDQIDIYYDEKGDVSFSVVESWAAMMRQSSGVERKEEYVEEEHIPLLEKLTKHILVWKKRTIGLNPAAETIQLAKYEWEDVFKAKIHRCLGLRILWVL